MASERGQEQAATEMTVDISARHPETQLPKQGGFIHSGPTCHLPSTSRSCLLYVHSHWMWWLIPSTYSIYSCQGSKPLCMTARDFLDWVKWGRRIHIKGDHQHSLPPTPPPPPPVDGMWPVASCSYHSDFPTIMDYAFKLWINRFFFSFLQSSA